MEINQLFRNSSEKKDKFSGKIYISIIDELELYPMTYGLKSNLLDHNFNIITSTPDKSAKLLREGEVELAVIPSIEYARKKEIWYIIPGICIAGSAAMQNAQLFFKKGLKKIKTIAVDKNAEMTMILLKILMKEKFMMNPDFIKMEPDLNNMFSRAEAALLVGDSAFKNISHHQSRLDLTEEWHDLTGLPYVFAFWAGREFTITGKDIHRILASFELGKRNMEKISKAYAAQHSQNWALYHDFLTRQASYVFGDREKEGLREYYNYAFFFGFIEFIPDLQFYKE